MTFCIHIFFYRLSTIDHRPQRSPILYIFLLFLGLTACQSNEPPKLTIATAANVRYAMDDIIKAFKEQTGITCHMVTASSGKLTAQISEGAPYDVFVSADMKYPETLHQKGLATRPPKIYAYGKLVAWTMKYEVSLSLNDWTNKEIKYIAIANPKTAPYGKAALQTLQHAEIHEPIKDKLVYGESISQVNQFVRAQTADIGLTALSVVLSPQAKNKGKWIPIPDDAYDSIAQGAVVIHKTEQADKAEQFYQFLFSEQAAEILEKYGYLR